MSELVQFFSNLPEGVKVLIVFVLAAVVFFIIKAVSGKKNGTDESMTAESAPVKQATTPQTTNAVHSRGLTTLVDTDEKTAAIVMAIVSDRLSIPLERLYFESIKCINEPLKLEGVSDSEAAVIMAITSHMTGKPLQNLSFSSIRLISE